MQPKRQIKQRGASLTSYGLAVGLIAVVAIAAVSNMGQSVNGMMSGVAGTMNDVVEDNVSLGNGASSPASSPSPNFNESFTQHLFNTCGVTGADGPQQGDCDTAYTGSQVDGFVTVAGGTQIWQIPRTGTYSFIVDGAGGGGVGGLYRSSGARVTGTASFTQGDTLYLNVGQRGEEAPSGTGYAQTPLGGFNGGGDSCPDSSNPQGNCAAGGGGTDIRFNGTTLSDRIVAAGGGGGGCQGSTQAQGGNGGQTGANGSSYGDAGCAGKGATQSAGGIQTSCNGNIYGGGSAGTLGQGGSAGAINSCQYGAGGGGGGGLYGGGGGSGGWEGSGGGGSSGAPGLSGVSYINGGGGAADGEILIQYTGP